MTMGEVDDLKGKYCGGVALRIRNASVLRPQIALYIEGSRSLSARYLIVPLVLRRKDLCERRDDPILNASQTQRRNNFL